MKETLQEDGTFHLKITNNSNAEIHGLVMDYYLGGKLLGTRGVENADGSALRQNDAFAFDFVPNDFPDGTSAISLLRSALTCRRIRRAQSRSAKMCRFPRNTPELVFL